jgi:hypothetical protein
VINDRVHDIQANDMEKGRLMIGILLQTFTYMAIKVIRASVQESFATLRQDLIYHKSLKS